MNPIEKAIQWAVDIANDDSHGYDQIGRWGPDYDCSSLIIAAWQSAGVPVMANGATYTGNMKPVFERCGFQSIPYTKGMALLPGDIVLNVKHHVCMYIGAGKIVQASCNERGQAYNGIDGDQTGKEISTMKFYEYSKGWDYVLRYTNQEVITVEIKTRQLQKGDICVEVGMLQTLLKRLNYVGKNGKPLTIDNDFGGNVEYAVKNFQAAKGIGQDGIVGAKTWDFLFKSNYI